ncbi:helix-turn-helix transcriptional regulator [Martelella alba]|uniref:Helix-turn-helix transcriptional regulator n=1 Tax=Martelella alba TaxID=2590451 RepID=A0A506TZB3_9HYPH|nr:helix-turn-helix domain-containing protein [Martelella alba]TPW26646.1 helix-turn-helix transcriptional regulator [Martelella alba]
MPNVGRKPQVLLDLGEHGQARCLSNAEILERIGNKWTILVIGGLTEGPVRFNALLRSIDGISHRMLTRTLRGLQKDGLVERRAYPTVPPHVEYELTERGCSLIEPLRALVVWASINRDDIARTRANYVDPGDMR